MPSQSRGGAATRTGSSKGESTGRQDTRAKTTVPARNAQNGVTVAGLRLPLPAMPAVGPKRALWWGGLAALAVVGVIEWPVAVVVGAGSYVAERLTREDVRNDLASQG